MTGFFAGIAAAADVEEGVDRGDGTVGTFAVPAEEDVESGVEYGNSAEFTGTLEVGSGGGNPVFIVNGFDFQ